MSRPRLDRRAFVAVLAAAFMPRLARAQLASSVRVVGVISARPEAGRAFEEGLRGLGWVEGKTVKFERHVGTDYRKIARFAAELTRIPVDVIYAGNSAATRASMEATRTVPIITMSADPVSAGFAASLARPGGNVTGLAIMHPELSGKRLELLAETLPTAKRIAVLGNPANPSTAAMRHETNARAAAIGVKIINYDASGPERFADVLGAATQTRPDVLVVLGDPVFFVNRRRLLEAVARHPLPAIWEWREFVEAGGLMAYGPRVDELHRHAATFVDRILRGAKPADLPIERATRFEFVINLKTAKGLGLTIPPSVLLRADQVIE
jgi:putative tryptophan/tyrosine transport system substrate-binding protein